MTTRSPGNTPAYRRLGATLLLAGLPLAALAMPGGGGCEPGQGRPAMHRQGGPEHDMGLGMQAGGGPLPRLLRSLKLDSAQQDKVFALLHAQAPAEREQRKAAEQARNELRQLAAAETFDAARARSLADAHARAVAGMTLAHTELEARVRALLTPEQRRDFDRLREQMPQRGGGHGPRHG